MIPVFTGMILDDCLVVDKNSLWKNYLISLNGKHVDVVVRTHKAQRSNNQNNYYFGVVCKILGDYFGYDPEEMHDALKMKFLRSGYCDIETVRSTTKLNTAEFEEYLEKVRRWAITEYNVNIPLPNEIEP